MSDSELSGLLGNLSSPDEVAKLAVKNRAAQVLRPSGAFERLDRVAVWLAGWQRSRNPCVERPHAILFAGDHGVAAEGVSAYPSDITAAMVAALAEGKATASVLASQVGASLSVVDVAVGDPTGNIRTTDALTPQRFDAAARAGIDAVEDCDADLLVVGEMGIGNTTPAAAVAASVLGGSALEWVGPGTGVSGEALLNKTRVVQDALERVGSVQPLEALRRLGGAELVAIAAAVMTARRRRIPVVLDGFITTASVLPLEAEVPGALKHCIAGHRSAEPGHVRLLEHLNLEPLLELDLRLGEGSGALVAVPLIRMAAAAVVDVATFEEWADRSPVPPP
ncbi:MAG: nicotinate-nucleotide--dimethylbenzimidazole phosphoribosyltransferase [Acidimicrobiaceae bacterium]|nr:nicotinate-nucleotide--dimethylbenzimidazole phosphoribosyltransferase [Acidimicrobiaceae bacterium]MYG55185.1 nicotinate-nucleotide--dimethylbenzimidazole phosphoribosyltransferase [Acidimicrobiaceae bacterium]MYJ99739.1 nicotinate-nucleotide--dimethylbenzimidazole phosphoribosyltransferase [Acidimicrobiaceae bacterium]